MRMRRSIIESVKESLTFFAAKEALEKMCLFHLLLSGKVNLIIYRGSVLQAVLAHINLVTVGRLGRNMSEFLRGSMALIFCGPNSKRFVRPGVRSWAYTGDWGLVVLFSFSWVMGTTMFTVIVTVEETRSLMWGRNNMWDKIVL